MLVWVITMVLAVAWIVKESRRTRMVTVAEEVIVSTPTKEVERIYKLAVMADIHADDESFGELLEAAKTRGDEMVIITGDLTTVGKKEELLEAKKVLDNGGVPYFVVPGNHDLWWSEKIGADVFGEVFGKRYQSFKKEGRKFILVDNGSWKGLGRAQKQWLEGELEECLEIQCLVFMHMPLNHEFSAHIMGEKSEEVTREANELARLLDVKGVDDIFTGHLHYSGDYGIGGFRTTLVGAVSEARNNQTPRFTEVKLVDKKVEKEVVTGE